MQAHLEDHLRNPLPDARRLALEYFAERFKRAVRTESAAAIETSKAINSRPVAQCAANVDTCCVVVGCIQRSRLIPFCGPPRPNAPKSQDRDKHRLCTFQPAILLGRGCQCRLKPVDART